MKRTDVDVLAIRFFWLLALAALAATLAACGGASPLSPGEPRFEFTPPVSEEQSIIAEQEYDRIIQCSGLPQAKFKVKVKVYPDWFMCGNVKANGCTWFANEIGINAVYFRAALGHELIHWLTLDNGGASDYNHTANTWKACQV